MRAHEFIISLNPTVPTINLKNLYHVGTLDASKKSDNSYEGSGLSVSTHPDAWRKIARGKVGGDTYMAIKPNNIFINAHKITKLVEREIAQWAIENGLLESTDIYRVSHFDDELDSELYSDYDSLEDAQHEAGEEYDIKKISGGFKPTAKLKELTKNPHMTSTGVLDYVLPLYAESLGYDGVWWQDRLNVNSYSAPRGVILPSMLSTWKFEKV